METYILDYDTAEQTIKAIISRGKKTTVLQEIVDFLHDNFGKYNWVGIYIVRDDELLLNSWKGPQATEHTVIPIGRGICGSAAETGKIEIVSDVSKDERYLACFVSTRSEIVVPIKRNNKVIGEIDIDSDQRDAFSEKDIVFLERVADMLSPHIPRL
jgi:GAF domain-containing protein